MTTAFTMSVDDMRKAASMYESAKYHDRKNGGGRDHVDALPEWVLQGRREYYRKVMRDKRKRPPYEPLTADVEAITGGMPERDWLLAQQWASDERRTHGVARHGQQMQLRDDGIIDPVAVEIAVNGWRVVRMTKAERVEAIRRMRATVPIPDIAERLGVSEAFVTRVNRKDQLLDESQECLGAA